MSHDKLNMLIALIGGSIIFFSFVFLLFRLTWYKKMIIINNHVNPPIFQMFITNHSQVVMFAQVQPVAGLCFAVKGLTGVSLIKLLQM